MTEFNECIKRMNDFYDEFINVKDVFLLKQSLVINDIYEISNSFFGLSNKYKFYKSLASKLRCITKGIIDLDISNKNYKYVEDRLKQKFRKLFNTLFTIILTSNYYERIEKKFFIEKGDLNSDQEKLILFVGMVDIENDDIKVYDELKNILIIAQNSDYYVLPLIACNQSYFEKTLKRFKFNIVHIAGHTTERNMLLFNDERITGLKFTEIFYRNNCFVDLLVLNCCNSELYYQTCGKISSNAITYDKILYLPVPLTFSDDFYINIMINKNTYLVSYKRSNTDGHYLFY